MPRSQLIGLLILTFCLLSILTAEPQVKKQIIILVPDSLSSLPFYLVAEKQPLPGYKLKVENFTQHAQALIKLVRGDAELLFTGTTQGWQSLWDGNDLVAINSYVWGVSSLVVKDSSIKSIGNLKDKKIALPFPNSPLDVKTRKILDYYGLGNPPQVQIEYRPFAQSIPLLLAGSLDAIALPEPQATQLVLNNHLTRLFEYQTVWAKVTADPIGKGLSPEVTLYAMKKQAKDLAQALKDLDAELGLIIKDLRSLTDDITLRYSQRLNLKPEVFQEALAHISFWAPLFSTHQKESLLYYEQIKNYFTSPVGKLSNDFFFSYH